MDLDEAIRSAVTNNPGVRAKAQEPLAVDTGVLEAASAWEPVLQLNLGYSDSRVARSSALAGVSGAAPVLEQDERHGDLVLSKLLRSGTALDLAWTNSRATTNSSFQGLVPEFKPTLGLNLSQPLWKNAWGKDAKTTLQLARNASRQETALFKTALADFVAAVASAYWDQALKQSELEVHRRSLELARQLNLEAQTKVKLGLLAPVAVKETMAEAAKREEELLVAENELELSAQRLEHLVMAGGPNNPQRLIAREVHEATPAALDADSLLATAIEKRPEMELARLRLAAGELSEVQALDEARPDLGLVGNYTLVGLGGRAVPITPLGSSEPVSNPFAGSYGDAYDLMLDGDFYSYALELRLELPLSRAAARARHSRALIRTRQARELLDETMSSIALDLQQAVGNVESSFKRVGASRLARELAAENLANQQRRYQVGKLTTTDVLDFQQKLASAMAVEQRALNDHARATIRLQRATGILLDRFNIEVEAAETATLPWWARF